MKKILIFLLLSFGLAAYEKDVHIEIKKQTNGGYFLKLPEVETIQKYDKYTEYTKLSLNFTAPRESITSYNHHSVSFEKIFEMESKGFYTSFSLGIDYIFEGNSEKLKEGSVFNNTFKIGYKK